MTVSTVDRGLKTNHHSELREIHTDFALGESPERRRLPRDVTSSLDEGGERRDAVSNEMVRLSQYGDVDDGKVRVGMEDAHLQG